MQKALDIIAKYIGKNDKTGVAVSGGADSVCLLHLLLSSPAADKNNVVVLNVEHGIRGESSRRDSEFVKKLCADYGVRFKGISVNVPERRKISRRSEESEAREARKEFFNGLLMSEEVDFILTAHNLGDRTEGVLMHVFRGCGIQGLVGMTERDGKYIRPLINCSRAEIEDYVRKHGLRFVTDETNSDTRYTRNFLRIEVLPKIRERYPLDAAVSSLSALAAADEAFISTFLDFDKYIVNCGEEVKLDLKVFDLPAALSSRYVFECVRRVGTVTDLDYRHVSAVTELAGKENGKRVSLIGGITAAREYDCITFFGGAPSADFSSDEEIPFAPGFTPFGEGVAEVLSANPHPQKGKLIIDGDKVPSGAVIRFRREGDVFRPYGSGRKKLKEYLIDRKIPRRIRDNLPLLCYNENVLAIFGVEISDDVKLTDKTVNALELKFTR